MSWKNSDKLKKYSQYSYKEYKTKYGSPNRFALMDEEVLNNFSCMKDNARSVSEDINRNITCTSYSKVVSYSQQPRTIPSKFPLVNNQPNDPMASVVNNHITTDYIYINDMLKVFTVKKKKIILLSMMIASFKKNFIQ